jgi:Flp pilus assembly pilin Flp
MKFDQLALLGKFWTDESGQDIVEYALLTALIGVASILTWKVLADKVGVAYLQADSDVQALGSVTPDPQ